jgi:hypothetical protein
MIKTGKELATACENVAKNYKSVYVLGAFGWPMTNANKKRAMNAYSFNSKADRKAAINNATADTFGFDCVCLIKALLWGWNGDASKEHGGAVYQSNGVPDIGEKQMLDVCGDVSEDFSNIQAGEYLWTDGHCGIYVGGGKAVECTYRWSDGVQVTDVFNISVGSNHVGRYWKKHGKLPYVAYEVEEEPEKDEISKGDYTLSFNYLRKGDKGEDVEAVQNLLIARGYSCGPDGADGNFGTNTDKAVRAYQTDCEIEVDGIVGADTMSRLLGV